MSPVSLYLFLPESDTVAILRSLSSTKEHHRLETKKEKQKFSSLLLPLKCWDHSVQKVLKKEYELTPEILGPRLLLFYDLKS